MRLGGYVNKLISGEPFAFSRWGDGEWAALLGDGGATCDGQRYSATLRRELTAVLESRPAYHLGLQRFAMQQRGAEIKGWLERRGLDPKWADADVFARASREGRLGPLVAALAARRVVLIGPDYLRKLKLFPFAAFVAVPSQDAYGSLADILDAARLVVEELGVVAVSAGPAAKLIVHRLHEEFPLATVVDFGSLWEPYVGRSTRTYHDAVLARLRGQP